MLSLNGFDRFLYEFALNGTIEDCDSTIEHDLRISTEVPVRSVRAVAARTCNVHEVKGIDTSLGLLMKSLGVSRVRSARGGRKREFVYCFPSLDEFRRLVSKRLNLPIESNSSDGDL